MFEEKYSIIVINYYKILRITGVGPMFSYYKLYVHVSRFFACS